jgi:hypothetical protein
MFKIVNDAVKIHRMSICKSCDFLRTTLQTCEKCGCFMPAKTSFSNSSCPVNKWTSMQNQTITHANLVNMLEEQIVESWNKQ